MKTVFLVFSTFCLSLFCVAAQPNAQYVNAMKNAIDLYDSVETYEDYQPILNRFERIAAAESKEWLPNYYAALTYIYMSFNKELDDDARDAFLDKAEEKIELAQAIVGENVELLILEGYAKMASVSISPAIRGVYMSPKVSGLFSKAVAMAPQNPRAILMNARWKMGTAQFFGQDPAEYCAQVESTIALFEKEDNAGIAPNWGMNQAQGVLKSCATK